MNTKQINNMSVKLNRIGLLAIGFLQFVALTATAQDMSSTKAEFKEFAQVMSGRFQSDIKLIHDWPGQDKKKGDRISGIRVGKMIADGDGLICTDAAGTGTAIQPDRTQDPGTPPHARGEHGRRTRCLGFFLRRD